LAPTKQGSVRPTCHASAQTWAVLRGQRGEIALASLLDRVSDAAAELRRAEEERTRARDRLRIAILAANDEGIPLSKIERAAGLTRTQVRVLTGR
jgi:hypothetical protein